MKLYLTLPLADVSKDQRLNEMSDRRKKIPHVLVSIRVYES